MIDPVQGRRLRKRALAPIALALATTALLAGSAYAADRHPDAGTHRHDAARGDGARAAPRSAAPGLDDRQPAVGRGRADHGLVGRPRTLLGLACAIGAGAGSRAATALAAADVRAVRPTSAHGPLGDERLSDDAPLAHAAARHPVLIV